MATGRRRAGALRHRTWVGRTARVLGASAAALWLVPIVGSVVGGGPVGDEDPALLETAGVVALSLANVGAVVVAFVRARPGGWLLVVTGSLFCVFALVTAGRNHVLALSVSGGPFVVAGVLFLVEARRAGADGSPADRAARGPDPS